MEKVRQITSTLNMLLSSLEPSRERAMVLRWKEEAESYSKRREQRLKVLKAIEDGYDTLTEIQAETSIPRSTCYKTLRRLLQDNSITKTWTKKPGSRDELRFEIIAKK